MKWLHKIPAHLCRRGHQIANSASSILGHPERICTVAKVGAIVVLPPGCRYPYLRLAISLYLLTPGIPGRKNVKFFVGAVVCRAALEGDNILRGQVSQGVHQ